MLHRSTLAFAVSLALISTACGSDSSDDDGPDDVQADAQTSGAADAGAEETLPFMSPCDPQNDLCDEGEGHICFSFNNGGPHCTHSCEVPEDCEAPSEGCNGMGVCKRPGG